MICLACRKAGQANEEGLPAALVRGLHFDCLNMRQGALTGTWCDCQHATGRALVTLRPSR